MPTLGASGISRAIAPAPLHAMPPMRYRDRMGPVNWLAVALAAMVATGLAAVWYARLFRARAPRLGLTLIVMLFAATMIGHNFARVGGDTLAAKPWLYWMMSGGFALWFAAPAAFLVLARHGARLRERLVDAGYLILAYLAMGTTFWALA